VLYACAFPRVSSDVRRVNRYKLELCRTFTAKHGYNLLAHGTAWHGQILESGCRFEGFT
jgi:hypothetical protein